MQGRTSMQIIVQGRFGNFASMEVLFLQKLSSLILLFPSLRLESISAAGRALASKRLGERRYLEMPAPRFFTECYDARSRLVHGRDPPEYKELGRLAASLEVFVSDLLIQPYFADAAT